jgi:hypothetical protein
MLEKAGGSGERSAVFKKEKNLDHSRVDPTNSGRGRKFPGRSASAMLWHFVCVRRPGQTRIANPDATDTNVARPEHFSPIAD